VKESSERKRECSGFILSERIVKEIKNSYLQQTPTQAEKRRMDHCIIQKGFTRFKWDKSFSGVELKQAIFEKEMHRNISAKETSFTTTTDGRVANPPTLYPPCCAFLTHQPDKKRMGDDGGGGCECGSFLENIMQSVFILCLSLHPSVQTRIIITIIILEMQSHNLSFSRRAFRLKR
jgi:hypothetical protein